MSTRRKSYRVPAGRIVGLNDLRARVATASDMVHHLDATSPAEEFQQAMEALHEAYWIAAALAGNNSRTECREHPQGPVDPEAPDGWGVCLLCNSRRRAGLARPHPATGQNLTGATSAVNRPRRSLEAARQPSPPESAQWREPAHLHAAQLEPDSLILARRRQTADPVRARALARARQEKAARRAEGTP